MAEKKNFVIVHNLDGLDEAQINQYLRDLSEYFKISPDLNAFDTIWMNDETTTLRKRTVYARRGTTDLLRDIHKISVDEMSQIEIPGTVSFKAGGKNAEGRRETAVGSCGTEGLKGQKLADAVMTAETRAGRRLTIKFLGLGILDESEVSTATSNIASSGASLAQLSGSGVVLPPPQAAPSVTPGKDVTPPCHCGPNECCVRCQHVGGNGADRLAPSQNETPAPAPQIATIPEGIRCLDCKALLSDHALVNSERICPLGAVEAAAQASAEPKKRRGRKPRGQVDISSPGQVSTQVETAPKNETPVQTAIPPGQIDAAGTITPVKTEYQVPLPPHVGTNVVVQVPPPIPPLAVSVSTQVAPAAPAQVKSASVPTIDKAKQDEYKARLRKYYIEILPNAGLLPSENVGGPTMKLRKFASLQIGVEVPVFTEENYEELFQFLDGYVAQHGPQALVAYIDKSLGVGK